MSQYRRLCSTVLTLLLAPVGLILTGAPAAASYVVPMPTDLSTGLDRIDQHALPLSGYAAKYNFTATGAGVTAYVIDSGVRLTHADFQGRATLGIDLTGGNGTDVIGHGTFVAAEIGGKTYGAAKAVNIVSVQVQAANTNIPFSMVIAGIDWVTAHAHKPAVANISLSSPGVYPPLDAAVQRLIKSGVTVIIAAGNNNQDACLHSPGSTPQAITVASTNATTDTRATDSNYGNCVDLFAPGVKANSAAKTSDTAFTQMSGTSMATPLVTGVAALYLSKHPTATPATVRNALVAASTPGVVKDAKSPNSLLYSLVG